MNLIKKFRARALVKWLWEETRVPKVISSNPSTVYWVDIFSHLFIVRIIMFFEKMKINEKEAILGKTSV